MKRRGQGTLEYAILIAVVIAAFVGLQHYIRRGVIGKLRSASNDISEEQFSFKNTKRINNVTYESGYTTTESFGIDANSVTEVEDAKNRPTGNEGVSYYKPDASKTVTRQTQNVNTNLTNEGLFE